MFNDLKVAFEDKSDRDLNRAYILFKTISNPLISKTLTLCLRIGIWMRLPIQSIIKATVYKHFCGGTTIKNSEKIIDKLWMSNIGTILDFSAEGKESEIDFNNVMQETIESLQKHKKQKKFLFSFQTKWFSAFQTTRKNKSWHQIIDRRKNRKDCI